MVPTRIQMSAAAVLAAVLLAAGAGVVAAQAGIGPGGEAAGGATARAIPPRVQPPKGRSDQASVYVITDDRARAADLGLTPGDVVRDVTAVFRFARPTRRTASWIDPASANRYFVRREDIRSIDELLDIPIATSALRPIPLRNLVVLTRENRTQRESDLARARADLEQAMARLAQDRAALADARDRQEALGAGPGPTAGQGELRTPRALYERLAREYDRAQQSYINALRSYRTHEEFEEAQKKDPDEEEFARRFLLLARSHPEDPVAVDAINWVLTTGDLDSGPYAEKAVDLLIKDHLRRGRFGPACRDLTFIADRNAERLFRAALEQSEDREVRGWSSFGLAQCRLVQVVLGHSADPKGALAEAEALYQRAGEAYGDLVFPRRLWPDLARRTDRWTGVRGTAIESGHNSLADLARMKLMVLRAHRDLVVGQPAYEIEGKDIDGNPIKLSDHRGQVVVLVFFLAGERPFRDMIPRLRELAGRMQGRPFALLGISGDGDHDDLKRFVDREGIHWRCWWDDGKVIWNGEGPIWTRWDISSTPTIYVLDHRGVIRFKDPASDRLEAAVRVLLKEREAADIGQPGDHRAITPAGR
jgi:peroxiredoxin